MTPEQTVPTKTLRLQYFARLREERGLSEEVIQTSAATPADLYAELKARFGFSLERQSIRAAVNASFALWDAPLREGDQVVFIPPVAGG